MITYGKPRRRIKNGRTSSAYWVRCYDRATRRQFWRSTHCKSLEAAREWVRTQEVNRYQHRDRYGAVAAQEPIDGAAALS